MPVRLPRQCFVCCSSQGSQVESLERNQILDANFLKKIRQVIPIRAERNLKHTGDEGLLLFKEPLPQEHELAKISRDRRNIRVESSNGDNL